MGLQDLEILQTIKPRLSETWRNKPGEIILQ
jgi:hypothetical protein